jgi:hypothetical protein
VDLKVFERRVCPRLGRVIEDFADEKIGGRIGSAAVREERQQERRHQEEDGEQT